MGENKELIAVVDLLTDAVKDGVQIAEGGGFSVVNLAKFSNLLPELLPAVQGLGMVPAEIKALTFKDDEAIVLHVVERLAITNAKALAIVNASLALAADIVSLIQAIHG